MTPAFSIPLKLATKAINARLIWFEPPEQALCDGVRFLAYAFRHATAADMAVLRDAIGDTKAALALSNAPAGTIDPRSWAYWHLVLKNETEPPPMPTRRLSLHANPRPSSAILFQNELYP